MGRPRKYNLNENYFENINTHEKAYILGFIYADGSIFKNYLSIVISKKDIEILNFINRELNSEYQIKDFGENYVKLTICSEKLINDLTSLGIIQNKTYLSKTLTLNNNNIFFPSMICGFFDGDGSIYSNKRFNRKQKEFTCSFSSNIWVLQEIKDFLLNNNISSCKIRHRRENNFSCQLEIRGAINIEKIYNLLYKNTTFFLNRKHNRFIESIILKSNIKIYSCFRFNFFSI